MSVQKIIESLPNRTKAERAAMREKAERNQVAGTPAQQADAVALLAAMEAIEAREHDAFIGALKGLDVPQRLIRAFTDAAMTKTDAKVLQTLLDNPGATSEQLSIAAGWRSNGWHLHFGTMCERRAAYLWPAPRAEKRDANFWSGILADFDDATRGFAMKPEVAAALEQFGLHPAKSVGT